MKYSLTNSFSFPYDTSVVTSFSSTLALGVQTQLTSKIGIYPLTLTALYDIPIVIQASVTFNVEVIHPCTKNVVKSNPIPNLTYIIGSPKLSYTFNAWSQTMG
jgi:hypothetical protein